MNNLGASHYYFMLLTNKTARYDPKQTKRGMGMKIKEAGYQVAFSCILPVKRANTNANWRSKHGCSDSVAEGFGFFKSGVVLKEAGLPNRDRIHLTEEEKLCSDSLI